MSKLRYAQRKDANQRGIVDALVALGCDVFVTHEPVDLIVGFRGKTMLLEVKDGNKPPSERRHTPAQKKFHATWRGHKATVLSADEAINCVLEHAR